MGEEHLQKVGIALARLVMKHKWMGASTRGAFAYIEPPVLLQSGKPEGVLVCFGGLCANSSKNGANTLKGIMWVMPQLYHLPGPVCPWAEPHTSPCPRPTVGPYECPCRALGQDMSTITPFRRTLPLMCWGTHCIAFPSICSRTPMLGMSSPGLMPMWSLPPRSHHHPWFFL